MKSEIPRHKITEFAEDVVWFLNRREYKYAVRTWEEFKVLAEKNPKTYNNDINRLVRAVTRRGIPRATLYQMYGYVK